MPSGNIGGFRKVVLHIDQKPFVYRKTARFGGFLRKSPFPHRHGLEHKLDVAEHESRLANRLLETLRGLPDVRIVGQLQAAPGQRAATISFVPGNRKPSAIVQQLSDRNIAVRNGHFYALRCLEALGLEDPDEGVIRISLVHYNTLEEVNRLSEALRIVLG